jgi:hypothetical protein
MAANENDSETSAGQSLGRSDDVSEVKLSGLLNLHTAAQCTAKSLVIQQLP